MNVSASRIVQVSPEAAWALLSDTTRYAEWVAATDEVTRTDGPARLDSTYDEVNPIAGPWKARTSWRVDEYEQGRRQVHSSSDLPLTDRFEVVMEVEPHPDGSRVTITLRGETAMGPIGAAFERLMAPTVRKDNERTVEAFAELAAREASA